MANRTQIRLQQVSGSLMNLKSEAAQYVTPAASSALTGSDLQDILGVFAASLNRIHGAASDEPFNNAAGVIRSATNSASAIKLHADAGSSQTIQFLNDEGTANNAIDIEATAGGINLEFAASKQAQLTNANADLFIKLVDNAAATANEKITIKNTNGTGDDSIIIDSDAGGIDIDAAKSITLTSAENEADAIVINASAGGLDITAAGAAGEDIDIANTAGSVNISAGEAAADAIVIDASAAGGGIDITAGNAANDANSNIDIIAHNILNISANGTDANDGVIVNLGTTNANSVFHVKDSGGNSAFKVDGAKAVTMGGTLDVTSNLTVNGNLDVNGTTTTIDTVNLSVQDSIIALGVSGSGDYSNVGDRGILFPRGTAGSITAGLWWDNTQFNLAKTQTGPTSASFGSVGANNYAALKLGNLLPGEDDTYDLGSSSLAWKDLHLEGDVLMTDAGRVETAAGDLTIASAAAQVVIDAETDIELNAKGNNVFIKKDANNVLEVTSMDPGTGKLIGIVSASIGSLALVSAQGAGEIHLAKGPFTANSATLDIVHNATRKVQFKMGNLQEARVRLELDDQNAASCIHDLSGSLLLDDGASSGEIRFQEAGAGNHFMGIRAPDSVTADKTLILPDGHPSANDAVLVASTAGVISYSTALGATTKGIYVLTASHAADVNFRVTDDNAQHVAVSDSIGSLEKTDAQGKNLDVFVNGQLLQSGSTIAGAGANADYKIHDTQDIRFAFALEIDDIVQIIKRG